MIAQWRTYLNNSESWNTHIHTLRHMPLFSQFAYTNSKPKIIWNNAFSVKPKHNNSQILLASMHSTVLTCRAVKKYPFREQNRLKTITTQLTLSVCWFLLASISPCDFSGRTCEWHAGKQRTEASAVLVQWFCRNLSAHPLTFQKWSPLDLTRFAPAEQNEIGKTKVWDKDISSATIFETYQFCNHIWDNQL